MFSRIWVINGILAILLVFSMMNVFQSLNAKTDDLPKMAYSEKGADTADSSGKRLHRLAPESKYSGVVDKNLFSSDRTLFKPEEPEAAVPVIEDVKISGKKVVLFGVIITDDYKAALINNPDRRSRSDADSRWVREGDRIGNLQIIQINADDISLNDGTNNYRISLYDPDKSRKRESANVRQDNRPEQPKVVVNEENKPNNVSSKTTQKTEETSTSGDDAQYEYIDTPFGKVKRKIK